MPVEGREQQPTCGITGKNPLPPSSTRFITKVLSLAERARRIRSEPLNNLAYLIDKPWLYESWKRLRKGAAYGIDAVSNTEYETNFDANIDSLLARLKAIKLQSAASETGLYSQSKWQTTTIGPTHC